MSIFWLYKANLFFHFRVSAAETFRNSCEMRFKQLLISKQFSQLSIFGTRILRTLFLLLVSKNFQVLEFFVCVGPGDLEIDQSIQDQQVFAFSPQVLLEQSSLLDCSSK
jgi:hypothetical protein